MSGNVGDKLKHRKEAASVRKQSSSSPYVKSYAHLLATPHKIPPPPPPMMTTPANSSAYPKKSSPSVSKSALDCSPIDESVLFAEEEEVDDDLTNSDPIVAIDGVTVTSSDSQHHVGSALTHINEINESKSKLALSTEIQSQKNVILNEDDDDDDFDDDEENDEFDEDYKNSISGNRHHHTNKDEEEEDEDDDDDYQLVPANIYIKASEESQASGTPANSTSKCGADDVSVLKTGHLETKSSEQNVANVLLAHKKKHDANRSTLKRLFTMKF